MLLPACGAEAPPLPAEEPADAVFFDDFQSGEMPKWDPMEGRWELKETAGAGPLSLREYGTEPRQFGLSVAGHTSWKDYTIEAQVTIADDRFGPVGVVGRAQWSHHYFELVLGRNPEGQRSWSIRQRRQHAWTTLATGPFDYETGQPYLLRFVLRDSGFEAAISADQGQSFSRLGGAVAPPDAWQNGRIGLVSYGGDARFDNVSVVGGNILFSHLGPWGHIALLRDTSGRFTGGPAGGWYVTPIHATLMASTGRVLITGFGRRAPDNCSGTTQRETGETWVLDPAQIDNLAGSTLFVQPIDEKNLAPTTDVLYCAGHNTLADGRIFLSAGTRFPNVLPDSSPERGLTYSRIYNPATGSITRISANMNGGQSLTRGEKWYPTNLLMGDGRTLMFGGFHWSSGGPGSKPNLSLEMFDPRIWDANAAANPYQVLTQHEEGQADTPPTRGYTNLFLLPKPVPAGSAGGWARSVALAGGVGRVFLFNHEPGPSGAARLHARTNALTPNPSTTEKGEGSSGLVLPDGTLLFTNGGHSGAGAARAYFYSPYADSWSTLDLGVSRLYGDAVMLPDGQVLVVNGYVSEPGNLNDVTNPLGSVRQPTLINPFASPRSAQSLPAWPEATHRGYHSIALLLKDGRVLIGGGKDADHNTGCEKNELRIFSPPNLSAGPRPVINAPQEGTAITIGGPSFTVAHTGTVRSTRGVVLLAPGSITHGFDSGQRYVPLSYTAGPAGTLIVTPPENTNIAQPTDYLLFVISDAGAPSVGVHVRLVPPAPRIYGVSGDTYLESECSSQRSGPWDVVSDAVVSGGEYLVARQGSGNHTTVPDEGKVLWYDLNVTSGGSFNVWLRGQGPTTGDDSFWVSVDGGPDRQVVPLAGWGWIKAGTTTFSIPTGKHQLKVKIREDGTRIDKIFLTKTAASPTGLGGTPQIQCSGPTCTAPAAPSGLTVTGDTCSASLSWTDNASNEEGFKVKRNGVVVASLPANTTTFNDPSLTAGSYTYEVLAFTGSCDSAAASAPAVTVTCASPVISNLVVNDTSLGNDGVANNTQWTIRSNFTGGAGVVAFGDRPGTTIATLTGAAATNLGGRAWIRTAADSKSYAVTTPPLATAVVNGSSVYLGVDSRHATTWLTGYTNQGYSFTVMEGTTARTYNVWKKTVTPGSTVTFPTINATTAPCYIIVAD